MYVSIHIYTFIYKLTDSQNRSESRFRSTTGRGGVGKEAKCTAAGRRNRHPFLRLTETGEFEIRPLLDVLWLYLDAEVLVLPPVLLPQDSVFVGRRLRRHPTLAALGLAET